MMMCRMWKPRAIAGSVGLICCAIVIVAAGNHAGCDDDPPLFLSEAAAADAAVNDEPDEELEEGPDEELEEGPDDETGRSDIDYIRLQLKEAFTAVFELHLKILADPATTKALAAYQWNYYQALLDEGFSKEQAFELVKAGKPPLESIGLGSK